MPFQKGHTYSKGHGRRPLAEELADYEALRKKWITPGLGNEIIKRVGTGKESLEDVFYALGFKEDTKVLVEIFKKLYPDMSKVDLTTGGDPLPLFDYVGRKNNGDPKDKETDKTA